MQSWTTKQPPVFQEWKQESKSEDVYWLSVPNMCLAVHIGICESLGLYDGHRHSSDFLQYSFSWMENRFHWIRIAILLTTTTETNKTSDVVITVNTPDDVWCRLLAFPKMDHTYLLRLVFVDLPQWFPVELFLLFSLRGFGFASRREWYRVPMILPVRQ